MADTAQLVVGLQLNDTNFKNKLTAAYRTAGEQSAKFNRQAQQDAKKTDESYQRIGGTLGGLAGKLAGLAGVELSLQGLAATSRQYGQALTELASITVAATAQMKQLDDAARQASSASGEGGSRAEEMLKLAGGLNDSA
ncbi:TPA: phage tail tape measure protein, partial [Serratia marcescens]